MNGFLTKVILSFVTAGLWIGAATTAAERLGSKIGGLIAMLPSTIVVSFIFIAWTQGLAFTVEAARVVPVGMAIDVMFLLVFVMGLKKNLPCALACSLLTWITLACTASFLDLTIWAANVSAYLIVLVIVFFIMERRLHLKSVRGNRRHYTLTQITMRVVFAGSVVSGSVIGAHVAGHVWAGIVSTFPAVMLSTLLILSLNPDRNLAGGTSKILVAASTNIVVFALIAAWAYPVWGLAMGTIVAYAGAIAWLAGLWPLIAKLP